MVEVGGDMHELRMAEAKEAVCRGGHHRSCVVGSLLIGH